jgi:hypothetical protein
MIIHRPDTQKKPVLNVYNLQGIIGFFFLIFILFSNTLFGLQVGSNTTVARSNAPSFVPTQNDNTLFGFYGFENGFDLFDCATCCSFDGRFPVSGTMNLHGGSLYLMQNLVLSNTTSINTMGNIYGNGKTLSLSPSVTVLQSTAPDVLPTFTSYNGPTTINSCDWSSSGSYAVIATNNASGAAEVRVLYYDGINLTTTASITLGTNVLAARWQPNTTNFALGLATLVNSLQTYSYNVSNGVLSQVSAITPLGAQQINALSFNPGGGFLAIGGILLTTSNVWIYSVSAGGALTLVTNLALPVLTQNVQLNALSWSPGSNYLALGATPVLLASDLYIYYFDGTSITQTTAVATGLTVRGVDWSPSGTHIAIATTGGTTQNIRVYKHLIYNGTLTDQTSAYISQTTDAISVAWKPDGTQLLTGIANAGGSAPLRLYNFNNTTTRLDLNSSITFNSSVGDIAWLFGGTQFGVAAGTIFYAGGAYSNGFCFTIDSLNLKLQNNLTLKAPLALFRACSIDGNNHTLDLQTTGSIVIQPSSTLYLKNITLKNISGAQLRCLDNSASVSLDNVKFIFDGDYFFDAGAFHVLSNFSLSGTNSFVYRSTQQSTIRTNATFLCDYGTTLSYAPVSNQRTGISFLDTTGTLAFRGATLYSTATGLRLTQGNIIIDGKTIFQSDATIIPEGIAFGDGINANNDVAIVMMPGAQISIASGFVVNENLS